MVPLVDDMVVETTESFSLILSTSDEDVNLKITEHTVEIVDDDCEFDCGKCTIIERTVNLVGQCITLF